MSTVATQPHNPVPFHLPPIPSKWVSRFFPLITGVTIICAGLLLREHLDPHDRQSAKSKSPVLPAEIRRILDFGERFVLLSLEPGRDYWRKHGVEPEGERFHGWQVLGKTEIHDKVTRARLVDALNQGIGESAEISATCFNPRHGISAAMRNETVDLVVCFECQQVAIYGKTKGMMLTTPSPGPVFDSALKDAGLPVAAKP